MRVLVFINYYLPGYRSGGPTRSLQGLVDKLGREIDISIVTQDRDYGDAVPYQSVPTHQWVEMANARVCYLPRMTWRDVKPLIDKQRWDILYLQSFVNPNYTLKPLLWYRRGLLPVSKVLVAPRGEFSPGALRVKRWKKRAYQALVRLFHIYRNAYWHASTDLERDDILRSIPQIAEAGRIFVAPNLASQSGQLAHDANGRAGRRNCLRVLFVSRITEMKNVEFAIRVLSGVKSPVEFNLYGPIDRLSYWNACSRQLAKLPDHISAHYHGEVAHAEIADLFCKHDLLLLPTKGENFGHVILESLQAGCPVLISDRTPWKGLEARGVGWDLPLESPRAYQQVIDSMATAKEADRQAQRQACIAFANAYLSDESRVEQNRRMFEAIYADGDGVEQQELQSS